MAKPSKITRTVVGTKATVLCLNTETAEPFNDSVILSGKVDDKSALKQAKKILDNDTVSVCKVVDLESVEKRYGMSEQDFIAHAVELPLLPKPQQKS